MQKVLRHSAMVFQDPICFVQIALTRFNGLQVITFIFDSLIQCLAADTDWKFETWCVLAGGIFSPDHGFFLDEHNL